MAKDFDSMRELDAAEFDEVVGGAQIKIALGEDEIEVNGVPVVPINYLGVYVPLDL